MQNKTSSNHPQTIDVDLGVLSGHVPSIIEKRLSFQHLLPVLVSIAFPFAFHISAFFHSLFFTCHWISFVFLLYGRLDSLLFALFDLIFIVCRRYSEISKVEL